MTTVAFAVLILIAVAAVALVAYAMCRAAAGGDVDMRRLHREQFGARCRHCGMPTLWTFAGETVCPTCRKHEIEEAE